MKNGGGLKLVVEAGRKNSHSGFWGGGKKFAKFLEPLVALLPGNCVLREKSRPGEIPHPTMRARWINYCVFFKRKVQSEEIINSPWGLGVPADSLRAALVNFKEN
ncbi:hypothetical protein TNIN_389741 [Trichonephila inaurata madagascariensis]|uniref:Uncharacterized protein n=1 Tax=Trichonephila inaurata madagascariensis TaxID=2747483 RepID=A0A8X6X570_9ARAC|nr:hypothetical protein TNIN_389741 [Trichonephila inaurata madagascariensis]